MKKSVINQEISLVLQKLITELAAKEGKNINLDSLYYGDEQDLVESLEKMVDTVHTIINRP